MVGLGPLVVFCKFCRQNNTVDRSQYGQRNKSGTPRRAFGRRHQLLTAGVVRVTKLTPGVSATLLRHAEHGDGPAAEDAGQPHAAHDGDDALDAPAEEGAAGGGALPGDRAGEQGRGWCGVETGEGKGAWEEIESFTLFFLRWTFWHHTHLHLRPPAHHSFRSLSTPVQAPPLAPTHSSLLLIVNYTYAGGPCVCVYMKRKKYPAGFKLLHSARQLVPSSAGAAG
jgi:hypothetical protein